MIMAGFSSPDGAFMIRFNCINNPTLGGRDRIVVWVPGLSSVRY